MAVGLWDKEGVIDIVNGQLSAIKGRNRIYIAGR